MGRSNFREAARVKPLRAALSYAPLPWSKDFVAFLGQHQVWQWQEPEMPNWVGPIAENREFYSGCALVVQNMADQWETWRILYCVQAPRRYLALCQLHEVDVDPAPCVEPLDVWERFESHVERRLKCNFMRMATAADLHFKPGSMWVLPGLVYRGGTIVETRLQAFPLRWVTCGDATGSHELQAKGRPEQPTADPHYEQLIREYPWLAHLDEKVSDFKPSVAKKRHRPDADDDEEEAEQPIPDDDMMLEALADVDRVRALVEDGRDPNGADFKVRVRRKGPELIAIEGGGAHAVQASACGALATEWCGRRGLQVTFKATLSAYSMEESLILARSWVHRMQFFFDMEMAAPNAELLYSEVHISEYTEPSELASLLTPASSKKLRDRVAWLRAIPKPRE